MTRDKLRAEELIRRFDGLGGTVHHYKGYCRCYVATVPTGDVRVFHSHRLRANWILPHQVIDSPRERASVKECERSNRALIERAKALPVVVPTLDALEDHLREIAAHTMCSKDDVWAAINHWCRIIEICATPEAARAFSWTVVPELNAVLDRVSANLPDGHDQLKDGKRFLPRSPDTSAAVVGVTVQ